MIHQPFLYYSSGMSRFRVAACTPLSKLHSNARQVYPVCSTSVTALAKGLGLAWRSHCQNLVVAAVLILPKFNLVIGWSYRKGKRMLHRLKLVFESHFWKKTLGGFTLCASIAAVELEELNSVKGPPKLLVNIIGKTPTVISLSNILCHVCKCALQTCCAYYA